MLLVEPAIVIKYLPETLWDRFNLQSSSEDHQVIKWLIFIPAIEASITNEILCAPQTPRAVNILSLCLPCWLRSPIVFYSGKVVVHLRYTKCPMQHRSEGTLVRCLHMLIQVHVYMSEYRCLFEGWTLYVKVTSPNCSWYSLLVRQRRGMQYVLKDQMEASCRGTVMIIIIAFLLRFRLGKYIISCTYMFL